jgi:hypothetical protein
VNYQTASHTQFAHPKSVESKYGQQRFKNYNQRVDVISGKVYDQNHRTAPFEAFTEANQHKVSYNQTKFIPADLYVECPITGRKLIKVSIFKQ